MYNRTYVHVNITGEDRRRGGSRFQSNASVTMGCFSPLRAAKFTMAQKGPPRSPSTTVCSCVYCIVKSWIMRISHAQLTGHNGCACACVTCHVTPHFEVHWITLTFWQPLYVCLRHKTTAICKILYIYIYIYKEVRLISKYMYTCNNILLSV